MTALRRLWRATSLRLRLVVALLVLVAVALAVTGTIGSRLLRGYLVDQTDQRLQQSADQLIHRMGDSDGPGLGPADGDTSRGVPNEVAFQLLSPAGRVVNVFGGLVNAHRPNLSGTTSAETQAHGQHPFSVATGGERARVLLLPAVVNGQAGYTLAVSTSLADVDHTVNRLLLIELIVGLVVLAVLAAVGIVLVRLSLRPLGAIETTAEAIGAGDLSRRVPEADGRTEVGRLSGALNAMLGQIERAAQARERSEAEARQSEERMRRFVADAGHELRTPLTSIRGFAELHRQRRDGSSMDEEDDRVMGRIEAEAERMSDLVEDLLLLAKLDHRRPLDRAPVDLVPLVADAAFDAHTLAPERSVGLDLPGAGASEDHGADGTDTEPVTVWGDEPRLRQILTNLVANALTHTPPDGAVRLGLRTVPGLDGQPGWAVLSVADEGPGLTPEQAGRVFERFYRVDAGRTRGQGPGQGGSGLGLSIVAALAEAHGGRAEVESRPGQGATFRVWLPLAPAAVHPPVARPAGG